MGIKTIDTAAAQGVHATLRISKEALEKVDAVATDCNITRSALLRRIIEEWVGKI